MFILFGIIVFGFNFLLRLKVMDYIDKINRSQILERERKNFKLFENNLSKS